VDVTGIEPATPHLQSRADKTLYTLAGQMARAGNLQVYMNEWQLQEAKAATGMTLVQGFFSAVTHKPGILVASMGKTCEVRSKYEAHTSKLQNFSIVLPFTILES